MFSSDRRPGWGLSLLLHESGDGASYPQGAFLGIFISLKFLFLRTLLW